MKINSTSKKEMINLLVNIFQDLGRYVGLPRFWVNVIDIFTIFTIFGFRLVLNAEGHTRMKFCQPADLELPNISFRGCAANFKKKSKKSTNKKMS